MSTEPSKRHTAPFTRQIGDGQRWWHEPMMWLVVGGPVAVVLASFTTLALALLHPDPVVTYGAPTPRMGQAAPAALQPAVNARNHAATGGLRHERP